MLTPVHMELCVCLSRILKPYLSWWVWIGSVASMGGLLVVTANVECKSLGLESLPYGNQDGQYLLLVHHGT